MKLTITLELEDDAEVPYPINEPLVDPDHERGLTEAGYLYLGETLSRIGADNIEIHRARHSL